MGQRGRWLNNFVTDGATERSSTSPRPAGPWKIDDLRRELAVMQPLGRLALVDAQVIDSEQTILGDPGRWAPLAEGESGPR